MAPEIFLDQGYKGFSADIWSLGILLYAFVQGTVPFRAQSLPELQDKVEAGVFNFSQKVPVSSNLKKLIRSMVTVNPFERISIPGILSHPWMIESPPC